MKKLLFFVLLILFTFLCAPSAWAAGGVNCGAAVVATLGVNTVDGPDSGSGESACSGSGNAEWFSYTATADGFLEVDNCGTGVNSTVYFHTTGCGSEDCAVEGDYNSCPSGGNEEYAAIYVTNGNTYLIEWTDLEDDSGFDWTLQFTPGIPGGETCAEAVAVTPGTHMAGGPRSGGGASACSGDLDSEWYSYTPTEDGTIDVASCAYGLDTVLYIHTTPCGSEDCAAGGDNDACGDGPAEEITGFPVTAGNTYLIEWTDGQSDSGFPWTLAFNATATPTPVSIPTMNEWGMIIFSLILAGSAVWMIRRKRHEL
jgi:hypothetical protein